MNHSFYNYFWHDNGVSNVDRNVVLIQYRFFKQLVFQLVFNDFKVFIHVHLHNEMYSFH